MWTASVLEYYRDLAGQLATMPGGHASLRSEYFGTVTLPAPITGHIQSCGEIIDGWTLVDKGALVLIGKENGDARLIWLWQGKEEIIAELPLELQQAAHESSLSPLSLALLTLAMGGVDDGRFKKLLPELHKASKGPLLIAVCRLCG